MTREIMHHAWAHRTTQRCCPFSDNTCRNCDACGPQGLCNQCGYGFWLDLVTRKCSPCGDVMPGCVSCLACTTGNPAQCQVGGRWKEWWWVGSWCWLLIAEPLYRLMRHPRCLLLSSLALQNNKYYCRKCKSGYRLRNGTCRRNNI